jgi:epsin
MSAKELTALIMDEERLRGERQDRRSWKSRVTGLDDQGPPPESHRSRRDRRTEEDDDELRRAIEASKSEAEAEELKRRRAAAGNDDEDAALAKALKLSKEEEELRRRELEEANANLLFDDTPTPSQPAVSQPTGWNGGYQQQPTVDWFGNVIDPNQPQQTGFGMQGQPTGYQNGFNPNNTGFGYQQPQQTGFGAGSPFGQPQNNFLQPQSTLQPQQTAFQPNNPYGQQPNGFGHQNNGFDQSQQLQPQDTALASGSNNPWGSNNGQGVDALKPLPTGSNNPFGNAFNRPQSTNTNRLQPTLNSLSEQQATTSFNPITNFQAPTQPQQQPRPSSQPQIQQPPAFPEDPHKARLNALLSSGEGQDTFGNVGDLRIPAQHTAPGVFVNSAGANAQRLTGQATGNPFLQSQFTGVPSSTGFGIQQTGPAGGFGASGYGQQPNNNPFGAQQRPGGQQGGGSLIDL